MFADAATLSTGNPFIVAMVFTAFLFWWLGRFLVDNTMRNVLFLTIVGRKTTLELVPGGGKKKSRNGIAEKYEGISERRALRTKRRPLLQYPSRILQGIYTRV